MKQNLKCSMCQKQAYFSCSRCQQSHYCTKEHQIQHWKNQHKTKCQIPSQNKKENLLENLLKKRFSIRKQYYENYSNKVFDLCVLDAKVLIDFQKSIKKISKDPMDDYEYGATICLLCRSYILVNNRKTAKLTLEQYLEDKRQFLHSLQNLPNLSTSFTDLERQIFQKKMNLISTIANLSYILQMGCINYYVLYTKHVERVFGTDSLEASNCYFLIGCYFAEEGFLKKANACFFKAAEARGDLAGDCYFNIGILFTYQQKNVRALQMFEEALKLREGQYGQDSEQIAEVHQNIGQVYVDLNDFITAMIEYEKSYKIRANNPYSAEYRNLIQLIHELYDKLCLFIVEGQDQLKKPSIFLHLKSKIEDDQVYWKQKQYKRQSLKKQAEQARNIKNGKIVQNSEDLKISVSKNNKNRLNDKINSINIDRNKHQDIVTVTEGLLNSLNQTQLFQLSQLQLALVNCTSQYSSVYVIAKSLFLKKLRPDNLKMLINDNPRLFQMISVENMQDLT